MNNDNDTPLHLSIKKLKKKFLITIIENTDPNLEIKNVNGYTPLFLAFKNNFGIDELIGKKTDINTLDNNGNTILNYLAQVPVHSSGKKNSENNEKIKKAFEAGCNPNIPNIEDKVPLFYLVESDRIDYLKNFLFRGALVNVKANGDTLLVYTLKNGSNEALSILLNDINLDVNDCSSGICPLEVAISSNDISKVEKLLEKGANIYLYNTISPLL
jgi:ankyrin repeat protein